MLSKEDLEKQIILLNDLLVDANNKIGDIWILPNTEECKIFAVTECGEVLDALMRTNAKYFRNRNITNTQEEVIKEITDVVMMIWKSYMAIEINQNLVLISDFSYTMAQEDYDFVASCCNSNFDKNVRTIIAGVLAKICASILDNSVIPVSYICFLIAEIEHLADNNEFFTKQISEKIERTIQKAEKERISRRDNANV